MQVTGVGPMCLALLREWVVFVTGRGGAGNWTGGPVTNSRSGKDSSGDMQTERIRENVE